MPTITPEDCYPEGVPPDFPVAMFEPIPDLVDASCMVTRDVALQRRIEAFQDWMQTLPQQECPVVNLFGGGVYARQVFIPKGTVAIGAIHLDEHINLVLQGDVTMLTVDGPKRVKAPAMFVAPPGSKKFGYANEDTIWVTVQPAISDDPEEIVALTTAKRFDEYRNRLEELP